MGKKILFADNVPNFLDSRAEFLETAGYQVAKAYTLEQARQMLADACVHLAIIDLRIMDDADEKDVSGLILAKEPAYRPVPKIILTGFPDYQAVREALSPALSGLPPAVDFLAKQEGPEALIAAIEKAFAHHVRINWDLAIEWKAREPYGLVNLIGPGLEGERLLNRAEEFEDLFRRLFYEKEHIRIERLLWYSDGRLALVVFTFKEETKPESYVVICGQNAILNEEARRFTEFAPKAIGETGTMLNAKMMAETTHFAANAYTLANNELENVQTLADLYRLGPEKALNAALNTLYQETLKAWHQEKPIREKGSTLDASYRQRLRLRDDLTQQVFEERIGVVEAQIPTLGPKIEWTEEMLTIHFAGQSFSYPNPTSFLSTIIGRREPALLLTVPGTLSGDSILTDASGRTWLTDFAEAGLAPLLWNFVTLEAAIRFDWVETKELQRRHELERCLIFTDFAKPDTRDLEPVVRKPACAIQTIRKLAARAVGRDTTAYHRGIFFHAARRLADFNPAYPLTASELARLGHILLSMAMIAERLKSGEANEHSVTPESVAKISISDEKARTVMIGDRQEHMPPKPFEVFRYLYQHANEVCTKEELLTAALNNKYDESYLHTLIGRIRKVIEYDPKQPRYLINEPNAGYRLIFEPE